MNVTTTNHVSSQSHSLNMIKYIWRRTFVSLKITKNIRALLPTRVHTLASYYRRVYIPRLRVEHHLLINDSKWHVIPTECDVRDTPANGFIKLIIYSREPCICSVNIQTIDCKQIQVHCQVTFFQCLVLANISVGIQALRIIQ